MFSKDDIKELKSRGLLNKQERRSSKGNRIYDNKKTNREVLLDSLGVIKWEERRTKLIIIDAVLDEVLLINKKDYSMTKLIKTYAMPILEEKKVTDFNGFEAIRDYAQNKKSILNKVRKDGFDSINKESEKLIKELIDQLVSTLCRYLNNFERFKDMESCKVKIITILKEVGVNLDESNVYEIIRFYYDLKKREIPNRSILQEFKESDLSISVNILKRLSEINEILNLDIYDLVSQEEKKKIEDERPKFIIKEISDEEGQVEDSISKLKEEKIENNNEIIKKLEFDNIMLTNEVEELRETIRSLQEEKEQTMMYSVYQYLEGIKSVINALNSPAYGFMLDKLYMLSRGKVNDINPKLLGTNLLRAMQEIGIRSTEVEKIGTEVELNGENIYEYRVNKGFDSFENIKGIISSPAWFYKREKIINQLVNIEEC